MIATLEDTDRQLKATQQREKEFANAFYSRVHAPQQTDPNIYKYTTKQKRLFHRTFSGLQVGAHKKQRLIFWTLTTKYNKNDKENALLRAEEQLNNHFQIWKKRICRYIQHRSFMKWLTEHYPDIDLNTAAGRREMRKIKNHPYKTHGPKNNPAGIWRPWYYNFRYKMCYLKVRTTEGGGVIHGLLRKDHNTPMLDFKFLQDAWKEIHHNSHQIEIHEVKDEANNNIKSAMETSFYLCGNYFNQQPVVRQSSSYNWIFQGAAAAWVRGRKILGIKKECKELIPWTSEDEYENTIKLTITLRQPNVLLKRPGLIQQFMNSRKSMRKDSGYANALFFWLMLTRHPHTPTRQLKLKTYF